MITVKVFRESGNTAVSGKKVSVHTGSGSADSVTDRNGTANFNLAGGKSYQVYVDGKRVYSGPIVGVQIVYV